MIEYKIKQDEGVMVHGSDKPDFDSFWEDKQKSHYHLKA